MFVWHAIVIGLIRSSENFRKTENRLRYSFFVKNWMQYVNIRQIAIKELLDSLSIEAQISIVI